MSDLSEGEKGDSVNELPVRGQSSKEKERMPRVSSVDVMENWVNQLKEKKLYIVLIRKVSNLPVQFTNETILSYLV